MARPNHLDLLTQPLNNMKLRKMSSVSIWFNYNQCLETEEVFKNVYTHKKNYHASTLLTINILLIGLNFWKLYLIDPGFYYL